MENIERTQFLVLTGHLDDQSLPDIIRTLRAQRKSGRLQVEYPETPAAFFFENGQMVDAQLGNLRGLEALYAALSLRGADFNFNPLVKPPERSIDQQEQKFIWDLVESPRREGLAEIRVAGGNGPPAVASPRQPAPREFAAAPAEFMTPLIERLNAVEAAILSTSRRFSRERLIYTLIISFLAGLILVSTLQLLYGPLLAVPAAAIPTSEQKPTEANGTGDEAQRTAADVNKAQPSVAAGEPEQRPAPAQVPDETNQAAAASQPAQPPAAEAATVRELPKGVGGSSARGAYVVRVRLRVKNGQVTGARVLNSRAAASAHEAVALKLAMQHQYPDDFNGSDTLQFIVERRQ